MATISPTAPKRLVTRAQGEFRQRKTPSSRPPEENGETRIGRGPCDRTLQDRTASTAPSERDVSRAQLLRRFDFEFQAFRCGPKQRRKRRSGVEEKSRALLVDRGVHEDSVAKHLIVSRVDEAVNRTGISTCDLVAENHPTGITSVSPLPRTPIAPAGPEKRRFPILASSRRD
jgi:hypothetical protein